MTTHRNTRAALALALLSLAASALLAAQPQASTLTPYLATGKGWTTAITATAAAPASFTIRYHIKDDIGVTMPWPTTGGYTYAQTFTLPANGSVTIQSLDGPWPLTGYAEIETTGGDPSFTVIYSQDGRPAPALAQPPRKVHRTAYSAAQGFRTGLALVNPYPVEQHVIARFYTETGSLLHTATLAMIPGAPMSFDVGSFLPLEGFQGFATITAPEGITVTNLRFGEAGATSFPVF